jgi:hypothetical protein
MPSKDWFRLPISMNDFGCQTDFKLFKSVSDPISGDRNFSIEIGDVADFSNVGIVNKQKPHCI